MTASFTRIQWSDAIVEQDAWLHAEEGWDSALVVDLLALVTSGECLGLIALPMLTLFAGPAVQLQVEVIKVAEDGALLRLPCDRADPALLSWATGILWCRPEARGALAGGHSVARVREGLGSALALLCLPLVHCGRLKAVLACSLAGDDGLDVRDLIARLTLVSHLLPRMRQADVDGGAHADGRDGGEELSPRQELVLCAMAEGLTNRQIAMRIAYSESTVRMETMAIFRCLGVSRRGEAVAVAQRRGIIPAMAAR